jgi:hypothetical protein
MARKWRVLKVQDRKPESSLEPASPTVPAAPEKDKHYEDNDEKCRGVHVTLLWNPTKAGRAQTLCVKSMSWKN